MGCSSAFEAKKIAQAAIFYNDKKPNDSNTVEDINTKWLEWSIEDRMYTDIIQKEW